MRRLKLHFFGIALLLASLGACATNATPLEQSQMGFTTACTGYLTSINILDGYAKSNLLSANEIASVLTAEKIIDPLCTAAAVPANTTQAEQIIANEMLVINSVLTAHKGGK